MDIATPDGNALALLEQGCLVELPEFQTAHAEHFVETGAGFAPPNGDVHVASALILILEALILHVHLPLSRLPEAGALRQALELLRLELHDVEHRIAGHFPNQIP